MTKKKTESEPRTLTIADAAKAIGCQPRTARHHAERLGLGELKNPRLRMLSAAEVERLRGVIRDSSGNPDFGPAFWSGSKRGKK